MFNCRKCELNDLNRSTSDLPSATESEENLRRMRWIDRQCLATPFDGSRRMAESLKRTGEAVHRQWVPRLMTWMGLETPHPQPRTTATAPDAKAYPPCSATGS